MKIRIRCKKDYNSFDSDITDAGSTNEKLLAQMIDKFADGDELIISEDFVDHYNSNSTTSTRLSCKSANSLAAHCRAILKQRAKAEEAAKTIVVDMSDKVTNGFVTQFILSRAVDLEDADWVTAQQVKDLTVQFSLEKHKLQSGISRWTIRISSIHELLELQKYFNEKLVFDKEYFFFKDDNQTPYCYIYPRIIIYDNYLEN